MKNFAKRYIPSISTTYIKLHPCFALKKALDKGYTRADLRADIMAGIVVGLVAIPLGMALAIASGVAPQYGLYTIMIAGVVVALLGGSKMQVTGPTAAFVVILAPIVQKFGFGGLLLAGLFAGIMLILMGIARMGQLIQFIPHPVTTGFTAGIGLVIATMQLKDFFGLQIPHMPETFYRRLVATFQARSTFSIMEFSVAASTLFLLLLWPRINKRIPAPLIALPAVTIAVEAILYFFPELQVATIGTRFNGIPQAPPALVMPWNLPGPDGLPFVISLDALESLIASGFAIAMLGAIESLLSAVIADGMAGTRHDPDSELLALGIGNVLCPFFGGIAATGAIARTATNIRFGARSPVSAIVHALFVCLAVLVFAPVISHLPMASLAALLVLVAYNMSEAKHFFHMIRVAPRSDLTVLLMVFSLTVIFDMVIGVTVGVVLAALLFMRRMAELTRTQLATDAAEMAGIELPRQVLLYQIAGPLFFGAAQQAMDTMGAVTDDVKTVVLWMKDVPTMDITGMVALETAVKKLNTNKKKVILAEVQSQPVRLMKKSDVLSAPGAVEFRDSLSDAIRAAKDSVSA